MADIPCVGAVVRDGRGRLLLVRRANPPAQGRWSIPGGRVESDESHEEAVIRELTEETGLKGRVVREVGSILRDAPSGGVYVIRDFLVEVDEGSVPSAGDDAADARWFAVDELDDLDTSEGLVETLVHWELIDPR
jgi:ADP-ribose pyrophosphatase YjhB (NUDIX family)